MEKSEIRNPNSEGDPKPGAEPAVNPPWRQMAVLAVMVVGMLAVAYGSPVRDYLGRAREVSAYFRSCGVLAPLVLMASAAVLVALGVPRLLFCLIAGMALGFWSGLFWAQLGTLIGNYLTFVTARAVGRDWVERFFAKRGTRPDLVRRPGLLGVVLARQLPVPGFTVSLGCGLVSLRHRDFLIGTALGQLPQAIPCTLIGAGVLQPSFARSTGLIGLGVGLAVVIWMGLRWWLRKRPG